MTQPSIEAYPGFWRYLTTVSTVFFPADPYSMLANFLSLTVGRIISTQSNYGQTQPSETSQSYLKGFDPLALISRYALQHPDVGFGNREAHCRMQQGGTADNSLVSKSYVAPLLS
jgi:hypothetical protein